MKCPACKNEKFKKERTRFHPTVKDEQVDVLAEATVCTKCGKAVMDDTQMDVLRRSGADAYREKYNLLTSKQIADFRISLGMSQREFAEHLGVGEASVKRWETYYVQDKSQDNLIRLKCDETAAEENTLTIHRRLHMDDIYTGKVRLNFDRVKSLVLQLIGETNSKLFLNKALFYVDFLHFKKHGRGITGMTYFSIEYGPCPYRYDTIYKPMLLSGELSQRSQHELVAEKKPDESLFDDKELETIRFVQNFVKKHSQQRLLEMSHAEPPYVETQEGEFISYELARKLKLGSGGSK